MKKLIILLLVTTLVFVITSDGFSITTKTNESILYLPLSNTQPEATNDSASMCQNQSNILVNVQANALRWY